MRPVSAVSTMRRDAPPVSGPPSSVVTPNSSADGLCASQLTLTGGESGGLVLNSRSGERPKVSVVCITYDHERYIRDALDGFLTQETDFPIEIIVADDASTDRTPQIVGEYADRHPNVVRPILRTSNVGVRENFSDALNRARGDYLALCEGDDYWCDPRKLAKQVDVFENHPGVSVCFHPVRMRMDEGAFEDEVFPPPGQVGDLSVNALVAWNFMQTNSVMYKRQDWYREIPDIMPLDHYMHVRHAAGGDIAMLPEPMAVYRRHPGGLWADRHSNPALFWTKMANGHAALYEAMLELFPGDPTKRSIMGRSAAWILRDIAASGGDAGPQLVDSLVEAHPTFALIAREQGWSPGGEV